MLELPMGWQDPAEAGGTLTLPFTQTSPHTGSIHPMSVGQKSYVVPTTATILSLPALHPIPGSLVYIAG